MDASEVHSVLRELLQGQRLAVLATLAAEEPRRPYTNLVAFAATADLREILFATGRATRKFANLTAEPRVALLMDSRSHRETDFGEAAAVTVLGTASELLEPEREPYQAIYLAKHPYLRDFITAPTCALLLVRVEKYILVTRFQEVHEVIPQP